MTSIETSPSSKVACRFRLYLPVASTLEWRSAAKLMRLDKKHDSPQKHTKSPRPARLQAAAPALARKQRLHNSCLNVKSLATKACQNYIFNPSLVLNTRSETDFVRRPFGKSEKQLPRRRRGGDKLSSHSILRGSCDAEVANMVIGVLAVGQHPYPTPGRPAGCAMAVLVSFVGKSAWLTWVTFPLDVRVLAGSCRKTFAVRTLVWSRFALSSSADLPEIWPGRNA
jgi:hypothetical protein